MGWTSARISKDAAIAEILEPFTTSANGNRVTVRKHTVNGSEMWHIQDVRDPSGVLLRSYIVCTIFECSGGETAWKTMDESMGPCYYKCPLSYFAEVPDPGGYATEWREKVRSIQAQKSATAARSKTLQPGQIITLPEAFKPCRFRLDIKIKSSWRVTATDTGRAYKLTPAVLSRAVSIE